MLMTVGMLRRPHIEKGKKKRRNFMQALMIKNGVINIITNNKPATFKKFRLVLYTIGLQSGVQAL
jgi:hypothetical protein